MNISNPLEIDEIKSLLKANKVLVFVLQKGHFERTYINNLQKIFSNYVVSEVKWLNKLIIAPSISTQTVLDNLSRFYYCIELFDTTAHTLMDLMNRTFDGKIKDSGEMYTLKTNRSTKQKGSINKEWNYQFHGKGCFFTNSITGQFLDVQLMNGLEFGVLDTFFLMKFIQTTDSLKDMSLLLNNESANMQKVIEVLRLHGYLIEVPGIVNSIIINRDKKPLST